MSQPLLPKQDINDPPSKAFRLSDKFSSPLVKEAKYGEALKQAKNFYTPGNLKQNYYERTSNVGVIGPNGHKENGRYSNHMSQGADIR